MEQSTAPEHACPLCEKEVAGRSSLIGHLEFGHDIDDGEAWLAQRGRPARRRRIRPTHLVAGIAGAIGLVAMVAGGIALYGVLAEDAEPAVSAGESAADEPSADEPAAPTTTTSSSTTTPVTTTAPDRAQPTTTVADTSGFRAPFVVEARPAGCRVEGGQALHEVELVLSGALDITLDGTFHPGDSGDGPQTIAVAIPAGTDRYLDEITVHDPAGGAHPVDILPPVRLAGC